MLTCLCPRAAVSVEPAARIGAELLATGKPLAGLAEPPADCCPLGRAHRLWEGRLSLSCGQASEQPIRYYDVGSVHQKPIETPQKELSIGRVSGRLKLSGVSGGGSALYKSRNRDQSAGKSASGSRWRAAAPLAGGSYRSIESNRADCSAQRCSGLLDRLCHWRANRCPTDASGRQRKGCCCAQLDSSAPGQRRSKSAAMRKLGLSGRYQAALGGIE